MQPSKHKISYKLSGQSTGIMVITIAQTKANAKHKQEKQSKQKTTTVDRKAKKNQSGMKDKNKVIFEQITERSLCLVMCVQPQFKNNQGMMENGTNKCRRMRNVFANWPWQALQTNFIQGQHSQILQSLTKNTFSQMGTEESRYILLQLGFSGLPSL
jgi:hypothetical protein